MAEAHWCLDDLRQSIDYLDQALMLLLAERQRLIQKILNLKTLYHIDYQRSIARELDIKSLMQFSRDQGLDPEFLQSLLDRFYQEALLQHVPGNPHDPTQLGFDLEQLRENLKNMEQALVLVLRERFQVVRRIGRYKAQAGLPPKDPHRFKALLDQRITQGTNLRLPASLVNDLFERIHHHALSLEQQLIDVTGHAP